MQGVGKGLSGLTTTDDEERMEDVIDDKSVSWLIFMLYGDENDALTFPWILTTEVDNGLTKLSLLL